MNQQPSAFTDPHQPPPPPRASSPAQPEPDRHSRKCLVCAHPERDAIDQGFLHWRSPQNISLEFGVPAASVYRHAHSTGLYARRAGKIRQSLSFIIEQAERCTPSADAIIRAVRAFTHINDDGKWIEPTKQVVFTTRHEYVEPSSPSQENDEPARPPDEDWRPPRSASAAPPSPEREESLIVNGKIRNAGQPAENKGHSQNLIVNEPAPSAPLSQPHPGPQRQPQSPRGNMRTG
jgi:hypothetical protein